MRRLMNFIGVLAVASVVTLTLFLGLQALTSRQERTGPTAHQPRELDFPKRVSQCPGRDCPEPVPDFSEDIEPPKPPPDIDPEGRAGDAAITIHPGPPPSGPACESGPTPLLRLAPQYPIRGRQGLDGDVILEFTINENGNVRNIEVIEATNEAFARSAMRAVSQ